MKFVVWDLRDGDSPWRGDGSLISEGCLGRIGRDNVYLTAYAQYADARRPWDLAVGGVLYDVVFRLSGQRGSYSVWRVE